MRHGWADDGLLHVRGLAEQQGHLQCSAVGIARSLCSLQALAAYIHVQSLPVSCKQPAAGACLPFRNSIDSNSAMAEAAVQVASIKKHSQRSSSCLNSLATRRNMSLCCATSFLPKLCQQQCVLSIRVCKEAAAACRRLLHSLLHLCCGTAQTTVQLLYTTAAATSMARPQDYQGQQKIT
jgi:hypothetical protein